MTVRPLSGSDDVFPLITGTAKYNERKWAAGAGGVDAGKLATILQSKCTTPGQHTGGSYGAFDIVFDPDNPPPGITSKPVWVPAGGNMRCRLAIAWNPLTSCSGGSSPSCAEAQGYEFDVCLRRASTGEWMACGASYDNNYEYLNVPCYSNEWWWIDIITYWGTSGTTAKLAWAFTNTLD